MTDSQGFRTFKDLSVQLWTPGCTKLRWNSGFGSGSCHLPHPHLGTQDKSTRAMGPSERMEVRRGLVKLPDFQQLSSPLASHQLCPSHQRGPKSRGGEIYTTSRAGPSSSCVWNPRVFADDARGWQCPFVLCLHPQGCRPVWPWVRPDPSGAALSCWQTRALAPRAGPDGAAKRAP